ncbi:phytanoyl-CoA dioxygenase family protein [Pseudomonas nitroreducens]|uniref:Phytanoyl-CoA dioxygenase family protein n=1 Tax=Pseudomonas nitroreducens TaxID=46680 RepID=A0A6G6J7A4_PSENT|nr:phytanoyl-CoA dioxygenase family protein [Pseudomonas nitroreducens]MBG6290920.1 phytanoyl-CoA dioxygenase family protein [Pseudomonas nitroreducens]NMZ60761.1 phytanoyl-CoA dioxygenase family protein [Pseudomonas nitroreducens]QIE90351.1 phytanoyl-CoA dioxygenase family protein [Pseudomonas nitroreducens]SNT44348.1 Ectoine hydroxylase-related dioxygenase, phytanoyl-CoA dioxygenase (PhyH) family [Pseudomonas nitroreducens]
MNSSWYSGYGEEKFVLDGISSIIQNGYCVIPGSVCEELVDAATNAYERLKQSEIVPKTSQLTEGEDYVDGKFRRMVNMHLRLPEFSDLFSSNKALSVVDRLFDEPATLYTSLFFEIGSAQNCHRDTPYFWTNPGYSYFGVWLALEDVNEDNGALVVIPGSHKVMDDPKFLEEVGKIDCDADGVPKAHSPMLWNTYQSAVHKRCMELGLKETPISVKKGDTIIWHPQLMHGGYKIANTTRSRKSFVMHVTPKHMNVFVQDKFFSPSTYAQLPPKNPELSYITNRNGREVRNDGLWAICQKIYLPA